MRPTGNDETRVLQQNRGGGAEDAAGRAYHTSFYRRWAMRALSLTIADTCGDGESTPTYKSSSRPYGNYGGTATRCATAIA